MNGDHTGILIALALYAANILLGYVAGAGRGRGLAGAFLAFLFPGIGIVVALFLPAGRYRPRRRHGSRRRYR